MACPVALRSLGLLPPSPSQGLRPWQRLLAPPGVNVDNFYGFPMLTLPLLKAIKTWSGTVKIGDVRTLTLLTPYPPPPPAPLREAPLGWKLTLYHCVHAVQQ